MPITLDKLLAQRARNVTDAYTERDSMRYAMAIGMGRDPLDEAELDFVYERRGRLRTVPTQALTVARHDLIYGIGMNVDQFLHGEQFLTLHGPMPATANVLADHEVVNVVDRGRDKGLVIQTLTRARLADGTPLFDLRDLYFARGDGGIGGIGGSERRSRPAPAMPVRAPDIVRLSMTLPWQALQYRQAVGDRGAIHSEPQLARLAGFDRPILHGSCVLGVACREILAGVCGYDTARITSFGARFTSVVYPGEQLETQIWIIDANVLSFRCRVPGRAVTVIDHGQCVVAPAGPSNQGESS